jgi:hypothetical protein
MHRNVKEEQERNIRALQKANNIVYSDQESDEGSDHGFGAFPSQPEDPVEKYKRFIEALPECPLNLGFHVIVMTNDADKCCFCPCGPKLENWRKQFSTGGGTCRRRERCTPNGFIDHLEKTLEDGCNYHWIVYNYLMFLYDDYWDKGLMHKAFYKVNQTKYKAAEAAQARKQERYVHLANCLNCLIAPNNLIRALNSGSTGSKISWRINLPRKDWEERRLKRRIDGWRKQ